MSVSQLSRGAFAAVESEFDATSLLRRTLPTGGLAVFLVALDSSNGGYFPVSWGWAALVLFWVGAIALIVGSDRRPSRHELAYLAALSAFLGWILLSAAWSRGSTSAVLEGERMLVYVGGVGATVLVWRRRSAATLVGTLLAAIAATCVYALSTRLFPNWVGFYDPIAAYRLSSPVGYWNGLGIFAAVGVLLALAVAARGKDLWARAAAGSALPTLTLVVYFTFSRGAWIALLIGLIVALAVDPQRLGLAARIAALAPASVLAVHIAYGSDALTRPHSHLAAAIRDGHRVALWVLVLTALSAATVLGLEHAERRIHVAERARGRITAGIVVCLVGCVAVIASHYGGSRLLERGYHSFVAPPPRVQGSLNERLFTLSSNGRIDLWRTAWRDYRGNQWLGSGAGSFEREWLAHRPAAMKVRNAHSLYLETLAELGPLGLGLLCAALFIPLTAAWRVRRRPYVPLALGAYAAYLIHAAVDWDWELTGPTLTALLVGVALLVEARRDNPGRPLRLPYRAAAVVAALALSFAALVSFLGASALGASVDAAAAGRWSKAAAEAHVAIRWQPWSAGPWQRLGEAQMGAGNLAAARRSFQHALRAAPDDWSVWFDLALASTGRAQHAAARRALALNPLSPEVAQSRKVLGL